MAAIAAEGASVLDDPWEDRCLSFKLPDQFLVLLEVPDHGSFLLEAVDDHEADSDQSEDHAHPGLGHDAVGDPSENLPEIVSAVNAVEAPSLRKWEF